ncbi:MAG TPA: hypothetical protein DCY27_04370 [Desulfobacterales bacterium]|nr:hypothetical protein [Desulfobacterales bacterium]
MAIFEADRILDLPEIEDAASWPVGPSLSNDAIDAAFKDAIRRLEALPVIGDYFKAKSIAGSLYFDTTIPFAAKYDCVKFSPDYGKFTINHSRCVGYSEEGIKKLALHEMGHWFCHNYLKDNYLSLQEGTGSRDLSNARPFFDKFEKEIERLAYGEPVATWWKNADIPDINGKLHWQGNNPDPNGIYIYSREEIFAEIFSLAFAYDVMGETWWDWYNYIRPPFGDAKLYIYQMLNPNLKGTCIFITEEHDVNKSGWFGFCLPVLNSSPFEPGELVIAYWYDNQAKLWRNVNSLDEFVPNRGYFVKLLKDSSSRFNRVITGQENTNKTINLYKGWNLIGSTNLSPLKLSDYPGLPIQIVYTIPYTGYRPQTFEEYEKKGIKLDLNKEKYGSTYTLDEPGRYIPPGTLAWVYASGDCSFTQD